MKKIILFVMLITGYLAARADFASPDFAFPQTVIQDAESHLKTAEGLSRMKAVMEIVTAKSSIDPDSLFSMPAFISSVSKTERDAEVQGLMVLYEAYVVNRIYQRRSWNYDMVQAPDFPLPENMAEWSGKQFKYRVRQLTDSAITILKPYYKQPLRKYSEVIELTDVSSDFYPYLRDFIYRYGIEDSDMEKERLEAIVDICDPGTPEWAMWATRDIYKYDMLIDMYKKYPSGLCGAYLLWRAMSQRVGERFPDDYDTLVKTLRDYLNSQPDNAVTPALKTQLEDLTSSAAKLEMPNYAQSGVLLKIPVKYRNTGRIGVKILRMNPQTSNNASQSVFYKSVVNKVDKSIAISADTLSVTIDKPGRYYFEVVCDGVSNRQGDIVTFTPWLPVLFSSGNDQLIIVSDFASGSPVGNLSVEGKDDKNKFRFFGKTDSHGVLSFNLSSGSKKEYVNAPLQISDKNSKVYFGYDLNAYNLRSFDSPDEIVGTVFVNRPVFHPGDSVEWSVVLANKNYSNGTSELLNGRDVSMILYDANSTPVDTMNVKTDRYGRASGSFLIPKDRLSGRFMIRANNDKFSFSAPVMVSDFKAPVFELKDVQVVRSDSAYIVEGRAMRYSGAAVPDATVKVEVSPVTYYRFWNPSSGETEASFTGTTGSDGYFKIVVPADTLKNENYRCDVTITSLSADVAEATAFFRVGKPYMLTGGVNGEAVNLDKPAKFDIFAFGSNLKFASVSAKWQLNGMDGKKIAEGNCLIDSLGTTIDFADVPVGEYKLNICAVDTAMFNTLEAGRLALYSEKQNKVPSSLVMVVPETDNEIAADATKFDLKVAVSLDSYVYVVTNDSESKILASVHKLKAGFNKVKLNVDSKSASQRFQIFTVSDGKVFHNRNINVRRALPSKKLTLVGESWRDRLVPGASEQWRLKLSAADGHVSSGALVATMYNHALDALASLSWPENLQSVIQPSRRHEAFADMKYISSAKWDFLVRANYRNRSYFSIVAPSFLYDMSMYGRVHVRNMSAKKQVAITGSLSNPMIMEDDAMEIEECSVTNAVASADSGSGAVYEEKVSATEPFDFRSAETLQAFWMPSLVFDENGEATLNFVVPNAIGAWSFRATAWTEDCRAASMLATLTASKPVMVQPTLPRFMRQGDRLTILATVINNTDSTLTASTKVEIFNPADNKIISTVNISSTVSAKGQVLVPCEVEAPVGLSEIGYRVKSSDGSFTDGEQALIPILEATTTAIDSELFYLTPTDSEFVAKIPADRSEKGIVAVQYCQNPVWDVVRTLPSLYDAEPKTAPSASSSIYAALVAKGLLGQFPEIRDVLNIWQSNTADSAFVSKLYKNEDLKLATLARTPFVGSANAMADQMQRLAVTFDEETVDKILAASIAKLASLQHRDGGFAWGSWSNESSPWVTRCVLTTIGRLERLGYKVSDKKLLAVINKAFAYVDSHVEIEDYGYTYLYSLYPSRQPSTLKGRQSIDRVKQSIIANWKKTGTARKATDALILDALGNKAVARRIMSSVKQFAQPNAKRGTSFGSVLSVDSYAQLLEAFARITPDDVAIIDGMRQWLVLQTQANDDMSAWDSTTLVAAVLSTGSRWTSIPTNSTASVTVDGTPLELSKVEAATGTFSQRIPASSSQRTLRVVRPEGSPVAYGSLVTIATQPMASVKARDCDGISIAKRFLVERDGKWVETSEFTLGQRVRVQLLVKASRNMEYVTINDDRPSAFEPVDQMPGWIYSGGVPSAYRENSDTRTRLFINYLPKGTYYYTYDMTATFTGSFASGAATFQSQYAPELTARSGASTVTVVK